MKHINTLVCTILALLVFSPFNAHALDAKGELEQTLAELVAVAEDFKGDEQKEVRREKMRAIIEPRFDFQEMAKRSLGSQWLKCNPAEKEKFVKVFSELLATTYLDKIDMIERDMVRISDHKVRANKSLIKTDVTYKGDTFGLDYKLLERSGEWKVYDVIIENIGLVANYRNEFSGIIRKEKFSGLLEMLEKKVAKAS